MMATSAMLDAQSDNPTEGHVTSDDLPRSAKKNGRFIIPWKSLTLPSALTLAKFAMSTDNSNIPSEEELDRTLPVMTPNFQRLATPPENGLRATWIGHATVLVQMDNVTVLTDPIFSNRCSPVQQFGYHRYRDVPCTIKELPKIDAVVISHNHYDHLDYNSVYELNARFGEKLKWFVPLGMASWMRSSGVLNVTEMDWWEEKSLPEHPDVKFVFTPAQHWSKRSIFDTNKVLWGSWCVLGPSSRFYFAGDTGYCGVFKQIGQKYGPFDLSTIPIGAYEPRWMMEMQHVDPIQAVQVHQDLQSKKSLGIHWGTFKLANEFYLEPRTKLEDALKENGISVADFFTLKHGESTYIGDNFENMD